MAFVLNDRVLEISTTTGTGDFTLSGAPSGYQTFNAGVGTSNTTFYAIFNTVANEWELGLGTLSASTTLQRTTVYSSSNANAAVNFSAGTKNVFVTMPASRSVVNNQANTFTEAQVISVNTSSNALRITQTGSGNALLVEDDTNPDSSPFVVTAAGDVGVGTSSPTGAAGTKLDVRGSVTAGESTAGRVSLEQGTATDSGYVAFWNANLSTRQGYVGYATLAGNSTFNLFSENPTNALNLGTNGTSRMTITSAGDIGIGTLSPTARLHVEAGTATNPPVKLNSGTNLTAAEAGAIEYDGVRFYGTTDTVSGRGYIPSVQLFRLTANGAAIGPAIANYFGANSAINLAGGGEYELEAYCYFTKTTAGTVTVTLTTSAAVVNLNGTVDYGAAAGGTATGAANRISLFASAATANAFGASASLTTTVNHAFVIRAILDANASNSDLRINFTSSAGTVTPLLNSYYKVTRLPAGNSGSFAA